MPITFIRPTPSPELCHLSQLKLFPLKSFSRWYRHTSSEEDFTKSRSFWLHSKQINQPIQHINLQTWIPKYIFFLFITFKVHKQTSASSISYSSLCCFSVRTSQIGRLMLTEFKILWKQWRMEHPSAHFTNSKKPVRQSMGICLIFIS